MISGLFSRFILNFPKTILAIVSILVLVLSYFAMNLKIDVSAETLLLEGDKDLEFSRVVSKRFESPNNLIITYTVKDELLNKKNIDNIKELSRKLLEINTVESVDSIVNVPLLQSPIRPLKELLKDIPTLETKDIDKALVKNEFLNSPLYKNNLVSSDFLTTALSITLQKNRLRDDYHKTILSIRNILSEFLNNNQNIKLHLGGVEMITDDMVEYVKSDLRVFGTVIVVLLIIILFILLKSVNWVFVALVICGSSLVITAGLISLFGFDITVVSSNFISLQLIMNMSLVVHLIIKYKELYKKNPDFSQKELLLNTLVSMSKPSFFVVITTIAGFSSLVFSDLLPVIVFGWMMSLGLSVSLILTFILFPTLLTIIGKKEFKHSVDSNSSFTLKIANLTYKYKNSVLIIALFVVVFAISGANNLRVENSFIDYFKKSTQTYQGMYLIDQKLGGTIPLDIILTFKDNSDEIESIAVDEEPSELDEFEDEFEETEEDKNKYWFTKEKMKKIGEVHTYLESQDAVGKVLSLSTVNEILKSLNDDQEPDTLMLALINKELPQEYRKTILSPYLNIEKNQVRISSRIKDSMPNLQRDELIKKINNDLTSMLDEKYFQSKLSGLLIMYNNMLQSLFDSQIKTIGVVILILFMMFLVLFKSLKIGLIAIVVNILPVSVIFGFMGNANIPLDMMTITIASISIGIAVDNTIHYIYRYNHEYSKTNDSRISIVNSHSSIGIAMFYTSIIIMVGFSILVLSNFIPTIYFGLLTMLAMFMAILSDLFLLPVLLLLFNSKSKN